jgi:plastocyanin
LLVAAAAAATTLAAAAPADAASVLVFAQTQSFSPKQANVLTGATVVWRNTSTKTHNVKFDGEGYNSGRFGPGEVRNHAFGTNGVYAYHCTIHDGMDGEVGVYPLVLEGPARRVRRGTTIALHVRAPEGAGEVRIEANTGGGFTPVAVAGPASGGAHDGHDEPGTVHATLTANETAIYRAAFSGGVSQELTVEVTDAPDISARVKRAKRGALVLVAARPATPGGRIVVQVKLRERFGWWPVSRARLDRRSRARLLVRGYAGRPARAVLVGPDWATPLSASRPRKLP